MSVTNYKLSDREELALLSRIYMLKQLREKYGNVDLETLLKEVKGKKVHRCPKCMGKGTTTEIEWISSNDGDMPVDSTVVCYVCRGAGFTEKEKKPVLKQDGWE